MIEPQFFRSALLLGVDGIEKLHEKKVAVMGVGGVGSFAVEALARSGIGTLMLIDPDTVDITNINRQLPATLQTVGRYKVDVMKDRILTINPNANVITRTSDDFTIFKKDSFDYIVDAVDTVTTKLELAEFCYKNSIKQIACMSAGNKFDPTKFKVADIYNTNVCPLCRVMRRELKRFSVPKLKVVYSDEDPVMPDYSQLPQSEQQKMKPRIDGGRRSTPGSLSFVPPVMGMIAAGEVIKDLLGIK